MAKPSHGRFRIAAGALLFVSLLLVAQVAEGQVPVQLPPAPETPQPPGQLAEPGPSLTQGVWLWTRTEFADGNVLQSQNPNTYTVAFNDDGRLAIRADCNSGSGTYTVDGSALTIQPGPMTLVACPPGSQDSDFLRDLLLPSAYEFDGPQLVLTLGSDAGRMVFSPQSLTGLSGPTWRVTGYNNGMDAVVSLVPGTQLSMLFGEDGRVSGDTGCNMFSGPYTLSGSKVSFGPLVSTRRACLADKANRQEQQFLAALAASTTYELNGDRLTFRDSNGSTQLTAVRPTVSPTP